MTRRHWQNLSARAMDLVRIYPILLGLIVIGGWLSHNATLVQLSPNLAPMQFNTALGFITCGVGLWLHARQRSRPTALCALAVFVLGLLTLLQYLLGLDFGIDRFFLRDPFITRHISHPGRMSPLTAICFMLSGFSLLFLLGHRTGRWSALPILLSMVVTALASVAFWGYIIGLTPAYGWGHFSRMALHTSTGIMAVGVGLLLPWLTQKEASAADNRRQWSLIATFSALIATLVLWQGLLAQERLQSAYTADAVAESVGTHLQERIESDARALARMAKRWQMAGKPPRKVWEADAEQYVKDTPEYRAVEWLDSADTVRWLVPLKGNEKVINRRLNQDARRRSAFVAASKRHSVVLTSAIDLIQGGKGFLICVPIFHKERPEGYIVGVVSIAKLLATLPPEVPQDYAIRITESDRVIYGSSGETQKTASDGRAFANLYGVRWNIQVTPFPGTLRHFLSPLPNMVLTTGILVSVLFGALFYFMQSAQQTAQELQEQKRRLRQTIESVHLGLWDWNIVTGDVQCDSGWLAILGYAPGDLSGNLDAWKTTLHPDDRARVLVALEAHVQDPQNLYEVDYRARTKGGQYLWIMTRGSVVEWDEEGKSLRMIGTIQDISDRKEAEEALRLSEERWQLALQGNNDGIWDWNLETNEVFFSERWKEMIGYHGDEIPNHLEEWSKRVHPEDLPSAMADVQAHLEGRTDFYVNEHRVLHCDGSYRWILDRGVAIRNTQGQPYRMAGSHTDITARKEAEAALRQSEERIRLFLDHAPAAVAMFDCEMRYIQTSQRWLSDYGLEDQNILGCSHYEVFPEIPESWKQIHQECLAGAVHHCKEDPFCRADGSLQWLRWEVRPWYAADGQIGGITMLTEDITARKEAEEALRERQHFIQAVMEATPNVLYVFDLVEQRNIYANRHAGEVLGYTPEEIQKMGERFLPTLMHPEDFARIQEHLLNLMSIPDSEFCEISYRLKNAAGEWRWMQSRDVIFARDTEGRPIHILGAAQDITERRWFEEQIEIQIMQVQETNVELEAQQAELAFANARLEALATTDGLTGLKNHRAFQDRVLEEFERSRRYQQPFSLLLLDVDHFKQFNDTYGHPAGDAVLKQVAATLQHSARKSDFVARYGGEEFAILLPETDAQSAIEVAERVREAVAEVRWEQRAITVSIGISTMHLGTESAADLIREADESLYASKAQGRNCVTLYESQANPTPA